MICSKHAIVRIVGAAIELLTLHRYSKLLRDRLQRQRDSFARVVDLLHNDGYGVPDIDNVGRVPNFPVGEL